MHTGNSEALGAYGSMFAVKRLCKSLSKDVYDV